ncbi:MAG: HmuY family protein [Leptospiraceae bacterium]|nr:HmuY family protein [Leptospiraceae bacterium]
MRFFCFILFVHLINCARVNKAEDNDLKAARNFFLRELQRQEALRNNLVLSNTVEADGSIRTLVNAKNENLVVKFDFLTRSQINDDSIWDIGFERFKIKTNSGKTNSNGKGGACYLGQGNFSSITSSSANGCPQDKFLGDSDASVNVSSSIGTAPSNFGQGYVGSQIMSNWYDYSIGFLKASDRVYAVRSSDESKIFALQFLDYYDSAGTSGYITFKWKEISK